MAAIFAFTTSCGHSFWKYLTLLWLYLITNRGMKKGIKTLESGLKALGSCVSLTILQLCDLGKNTSLPP